MRVLFVDDEVAGYLPPMRQKLEKMGVDLVPASAIETAQRLMVEQRFDLVLLDLHFPDDVLRRPKRRGGEVFLEFLTDQHAEQAVMVLTTSLQDDHQAPFAALSHCVHGQFAKPDFDQPNWATGFYQAMQQSIERARAASYTDADFGFVVGTTEAMTKLKMEVLAVAKLPSAVLIYGETGTGKQSLAEALHRFSGRSGTLQTLNCGAPNLETLESELFGHEKGAYTGAIGVRKGLFELAEAGTLFLDEAQKMLPALQDKLVLALQNQRIRRLGGSVDIPVSVRVISAFNAPLDQLVAKNLFREDLAHRLRVVELLLPPLRERLEDLAALSAELITRLNAKLTTHYSTKLRVETLQHLSARQWTGNIRTLENTLHAAMAKNHTNVLLPEHFEAIAIQSQAPVRTEAQVDSPVAVATGTELVPMDRIAEAVARILAADKHRWQILLDGVALSDRKSVFEALLIYYGNKIFRVPVWKEVGRDLFAGSVAVCSLRTASKELKINKKALDYDFKRI